MFLSMKYNEDHKVLFYRLPDSEGSDITIVG